MPKLIYFALFLVVLGAAGTILVAGSLAAPHRQDVGPPPTGFSARSVAIPKPDGASVAGWFAEGKTDKPGVLLLHGIRSDRRGMLSRGAFLLQAGYSVLMIDMQAHGETPGEKITFGFRESQDVRAALGFLRDRVHPQKVGVIGVSLGGAASLLGGSPVKADAVILESVYSSIESAVANRVSLRLGPLGQVLAPLLTWQIEPRLGIPLEHLSPLNEIGKLNAPVMIVGGTEDRHTVEEEIQSLFAAARPPKQIWLIEGAAHENFHRFAGAEYEQRILDFLVMYLERPNA